MSKTLAIAGNLELPTALAVGTKLCEKMALA